jgi:ubiquitin-protein ligase E3 C
LDPELYQGLIFLKHYKGDVEADLSLNFTVTNSEFDASETIELIPEGSKTSVTAQNRINYIYLMSNYKLNIQLESQCAAFFKGLNDIIELKWLRMFNQLELKVLVGGLDGQDLDIDDMQQWTVYGGWDESHPTIRIVSLHALLIIFSEAFEVFLRHKTHTLFLSFLIILI